MELSAWESSKENIAPLEKGRNAAKLVEAFQNGPTADTSKLDAQRQEWEDAIKNYKGDDPLSVWINYIRWVQQSYVSGGMKANLLSLLERCTAQFKDWTLYKNDVRYIRVWIQLVQETRADPIDIFKFCKANQIGDYVALFYHAWATVLENQGAYQDAAAIYQKGIQMLAKPLPVLKKDYSEFQARVARKQLQQIDSDDQQSIDEKPRAPLAQLTKKQAHSSTRTGRPAQGILGSSSSNNKSNAASFEIFEDSDLNKEEEPRGPWRTLAPEKERRKENTQIPTTWNKPLKGHKKSATAPSAPSFEIYEDPDLLRAEGQSSTVNEGEQASIRLRLEGQPNRNVSRSNVYTTATGAKERNGYDINLIYVDGEEFCFEEARAARRPYVEAPEVMEEDMMLTTVLDYRIKGGQEGKTVDVKELLKKYNKELVAEMNQPVKAEDKENQPAIPVPSPYPPQQSVVTPVQNPTQQNQYPSVPQPVSIIKQQSTIPSAKKDFVQQPIVPTSTKKENVAPLSQIPAPASVKKENIDIRSSGSFIATTPRNQRATAILQEILKTPVHDRTPSQTRVLDALLNLESPLAAEEGIRRPPTPTMTITSKQVMNEMMDWFCDAPKETPATSQASQKHISPFTVSPVDPLSPPAAKPQEPKEDNTQSFVVFDENLQDYAPTLPLEEFPALGLKQRENAIEKAAVMSEVDDIFDSLDDQENLLKDKKPNSRSLKSAQVRSRVLQPIDVPVEKPEKITNGDIIKMELGNVGIYKATPSDKITNGEIIRKVYHGEDVQFIENDEEDVPEDPMIVDPAKFEFEIYTDENLMSEPQQQQASSQLPPLQNAAPQQQVQAFEPYTPKPDPGTCLKTPSNNKSLHLLDTPFELSPLSSSISTATPSSYSRTSSRSHSSLSNTSLCSFPSPSGAILSPAKSRTIKSVKSTSKITPVQLEKEEFVVTAFDQHQIDSQLKTLDPPLSSYQRYYRVNKKAPATETFTKTPLSKKTPKKERPILDLENCALEINQCLGTGAYAKVYLGYIVDTWNITDNTTFAVKVQSPPCSWEFYICRQINIRVPEPMKTRYARAFSQYVYNDKSFLLMNYGDQGTLQDVVNAYKQKGSKMDEVLVMFYTIEMLKIFETLHKAGIIHGDVKPDNFLILNEESGDEWESVWRPEGAPGWELRGLVLIDFGRSIDMSLYPQGTLFHGDSHVDSFRCIEMMTNKPWTFQGDIFGICGVIHCLLHGSYMDLIQDPKTKRWRAREPFKRYWQTALWEEMFDAFLNIPDCNSIPNLGYFRKKFEDYFVKDISKARLIKDKLARQSITMWEFQKEYE